MIAPDATAPLLMDAVLALVTMHMTMVHGAAVLLLMGFLHLIGALRIVLDAPALLVLVLHVVLGVTGHGSAPYTEENCVAPKNGATLVEVIVAAACAVGVFTIWMRMTPLLATDEK